MRHRPAWDRPAFLVENGESPPVIFGALSKADGIALPDPDIRRQYLRDLAPHIAPELLLRLTDSESTA